MAGDLSTLIPILTDEIRNESQAGEDETKDKADRELAAQEREALIAELQTQLASSTFSLTDEIMRKAFAEMEATVFEQISGKLRSKLPEMIDSLLRERLDQETDV